MRAFQALFGRDPINTYQRDPVLQQTLEYYLGPRLAACEPVLREMGRLVGEEVDELGEYTDKVARPRLVKWDVWGEPADEVWLNPAHRLLLEKLYRTGIVARPFREDVTWHLPFAQGYLLADPGFYCPITVTMATALALHKYGSEPLRARYLPHLCSMGEVPIYQGATWLTEPHAGSDVGAARTEAICEGDRWRLSGEKYFASNVGAEVALVTARPIGAPDGARGLALFVVPRTTADGRSNYIIRRLKDKLGTVAVPTGEVTLARSEAYLVGEPEQGIYHTMEVLTLSRLCNAVGSAGVARRALAEAVHYASRRQAFGRILADHPLMRADLIEQTVEAEAALALAFYAVDLFDQTWLARPPYTPAYHHMRLVAHLAKHRTAEQATAVARRAVEAHGGVGFLEEFPFARWLREAQVLPIWEGAPHIQALELLDVIARKGAHETYMHAVEAMLDDLRALADAGAPVRDGLAAVRRSLGALGAMDEPAAQYHARDLLELMADVLQAALLLREAERRCREQGDGRKALVARLFVARHLELSLDRGIGQRLDWTAAYYHPLASGEPLPAADVIGRLSRAPAGA